MVLISVLTALTFFIMPANTVLFDSELAEVVTLPAGYFAVMCDGPTRDGYIYVGYDDLRGYVRASDVTKVDYTPVNKYEQSVCFYCDNDGQPVKLRDKPNKSANAVDLSADTSGHAYGTVAGDTLISGAGNTWYYVKCGDKYGYVYSAHVRVDPTPPNIIEKEPPPQEDPPEEQDPPQEKSGMSAVAAVIFIVALCLPVPFVMYYLFKKPKE